jgi:hypothetical protein
MSAALQCAQHAVDIHRGRALSARLQSAKDVSSSAFGRSTALPSGYETPALWVIGAKIVASLGAHAEGSVRALLHDRRRGRGLPAHRRMLLGPRRGDRPRTTGMSYEGVSRRLGRLLESLLLGVIGLPRRRREHPHLPPCVGSPMSSSTPDGAARRLATFPGSAPPAGEAAGGRDICQQALEMRS